LKSGAAPATVLEQGAAEVTGRYVREGAAPVRKDDSSARKPAWSNDRDWLRRAAGKRAVRAAFRPDAVSSRAPQRKAVPV